MPCDVLAVDWVKGEGTYRVGASDESRSICSNGDTGNRDIILGSQLVGAVVLGKVPDANVSATITADDLALVGVDDNVVDRAAVGVGALDSAGAGLPDLDSAILGACNHPLALAMECDARNVTGVALEDGYRVRVARLNIEELHGMVACGGEEALVGGDTEPVDLGVGVLDGARADT